MTVNVQEIFMSIASEVFLKIRESRCLNNTDPIHILIQVVYHQTVR